MDVMLFVDKYHLTPDRPSVNIIVLLPIYKQQSYINVVGQMLTELWL